MSSLCANGVSSVGDVTTLDWQPWLSRTSVERSRTFDEDSSGFSHDDRQWVMLIHCRTMTNSYFFYLLDRFDFKAEFSYKKGIHSFIHLFSLPSRSVACGEPLHTNITLVYVLFSLSPLSACFLSSILVRFLLYGSNCFVLLMNSTVCFIICGWPSSLSMFSLPFPMSLIIFFLCCLNLRHSNK